MSESAKYYDLTHSQKGIWYTEKLYPGTSIGNIAATLKIMGTIDLNLLEKAILIFIEKNEALHLRFVEIDGEPYQYVANDRVDKLDFIDFSHSDIEEMYKWDERHTTKPFQLIDNCLFYFAVLRLNNNECGFFVKIHHLIADGWSLIHVGNEVLRYYDKLVRNIDIPAALKPSYLEYAAEEKIYEFSEKFIQDKAFWEKTFEDIPELTTIKSCSNNRIRTKTNRKTFITPSKLYLKIKEYCAENRTSVFALYLSALAIYINRLTGNTDIVIGVPVLNRSGTREKDTIGMFISTIPLRVQVDEMASFAEFMEEIVKKWKAILRHHKYPYELLLKYVREQHKGSDNLYDVVLSYQNAKFIKEEVNLKHEGKWHFSGHQKDSLYIHINEREDDGNLLLDFDYLVDMFFTKEIDFMYDHIVRLLWHALDNPARKISQIDMVSELEKDNIVHRFNATEAEYDKNVLIHQMIENQAIKAPEAIAAVFKDQSLTYRELNNKANQLAKVLREKGIGPDKIAAIMTKRSLEMLISIVAVLKAGGAYLPIDPDFPEDRIEYMLADSGAIILIQYKIEKEYLGFPGLVIDLAKNSELLDGNSENPACICTSENLSYIIYTSGTTGVPKGVMLKNKGLTNLAGDFSKLTDPNEIKTVLAAATMSFDMFVMETLLTLSNGMKVIIANEDEQRIPRLMALLIQKHDIDMIMLTPSRMQMVLADADGRNSLPEVKQIILGGEALLSSLVEKIKRYTNAKIINLYGPTEITVYATSKHIENAHHVNIGKPISNTQVYILDKYLNPMPIGSAGEIHISGDGLAKGYINHNELTEERFIRNPFDPSSLLYKTGDLGRWYPGGEIEYLGRIDQQVKIRGLRIEMGEIENALLKHEEIYKVAVVDKEDKNGHKYLCAYFEGEARLTAKELRSFLLKRIPQYMIPSYYVHMDKLPATPSRKVDRKKLPDIQPVLVSDKEYIPPQNPIEAQLVDMWENILDLKKVGVNDNFFEIGGDSLFAINLISSIYKQMNVEIGLNSLFQYPTVKELAQYLVTTEEKKYNGIEKANRQNEYPLSSQQKRLYILNSLEGVNTAYNMPFALIIEGELDEERLKNTLMTIVQRHESLRTSFAIRDLEPVQIIDERNFVVCETVSYENRYFDINAGMSNFVKPFDISQAPLFKTQLVRIAKNKNILLIDMHHIVSDGASLAIFIKELGKLYEGKIMDNISLQYKDYAVWQGSYLKSENIRKQKEYWLKHFEGELPVLDMPLDFKRPAEQNFEGDRIVLNIDPDLADKLRELAYENNATVFMVFLAAFNVLLSKYARQEDIVIGSPFAGRSIHETDKMIGMFVNTIALRNKPNGEKKFSQFLSEVRSNTLTSLDNQDYPFEELVNDLNIKRDLSRNPIFDILLSYNRNETLELQAGNVKMRTCVFNHKISKFDLTLQIDDIGGELKLNFEFCIKLFKKATIERMSEHFQVLLENIVLAPSTQISNLEIMTLQERNHVLYEANDTFTSNCPELTFQELFEKRASMTPDFSALVFNGAKLSYRELNERSNKLARVLKREGVDRNSIVGIMLHRSFEMIIGILAIFKAGGAYLPIDPEYPTDRIAYILENSKADAIILEKGMMETVDTTIKKIDANAYEAGNLDGSNLHVNNDKNDLGYVIYTSGTTGKPKGVMLKRKSLNNLVCAAGSMVDFTAGQAMISITTFSFDIFIFETLIPLMQGLTIVIANEEQQRIPQQFNELVLEHQVSMMQTTPSRMGILVDSGYCVDSLRMLDQIILGGEVFSASLHEKLKNVTKAKLYNGYGPTETTVYSTFKQVLSADELNIGRPIANTQVFILDQYLKPVPVGVIGELCIGGEGVGKGYLNEPEMTRDKFVETDSSYPGILYRTGDFARWTEKSELEYFGRKDQQIKIRGLRIELGEIENQLLKNTYIKNAVVLNVEENGRQLLCAFIESDFVINTHDTRQELAKVLPHYMLPSAIVKIDKFPLSPNGKVDRKALLQYKELTVKEERKEILLNPVEKHLRDIWSEVLNTQDIDVNDNIFEHGGDSLSVILAQTKLYNRNWGLKTQDFYKYQTIRLLAAKVMQNIAGGEDEAAAALDYISSTSIPVQIDELPLHRDVPMDIGNVLILGATGYLGIHIISEILASTEYRIYCLVRGIDAADSRKRLEQLFDFYFEGKNKEFINNRLFIINGSIESENFGLDEEQYDKLGSGIDAVINSAAIVKHYGDYELFEQVNIYGTNNVIKFASRYGKRMIQLSTISVAGEKLLPNMDNLEKMAFKEDDFFIGQDYYSNVYVRSKFMAEKLVFEAIKQGLDAYVLRIGNLTGRYSDGWFQANITENAFYNRLKAFINLKIMPESLRYAAMQLTPVDAAARAIAKILPNPKRRVLHIYSQLSATFNTFFEALKSLDYEMNFIEDERFIEILHRALEDNTGNTQLTWLVSNLEQDFSFDKKAVIESDNNITCNILGNLGFHWPASDKLYFEKIIRYMKKVGFI